MRIFAVVLTAVLVVFAPYWLYLPCILLGVFYFEYFIEGIILAFLADLFYGQGFYHGFLFGFPFTLYALVLVCLSVLVREKLRLNA